MTTTSLLSSSPIRRPGRIRAFLRMVAFEHSIFALPFAYLATIVAMSRGSGAARPAAHALENLDWATLSLVTVAMVGGRTFAMAANRIIDRHIDAQNPRTAARELVTGEVSLTTAWSGALVALAVFAGSVALLNPLCLALTPLAVIPLVVYPYGKRFTDFPHAILGLAQMVGPIGGWLAVTGTFRGSAAAWVLGAAVGLWIGGFDLIYACQDAVTDRKIGVRSVPARYGVAAALVASGLVHFVTFALFVWFGVLVGLGLPWWIGLAVTAVAFCYEHVIVTPSDLSRVNRAFFTVNGFVGIVLFGFALVDLAIR